MLGDEAYAPTGREAVEIGLIDECVRDEELERRAVEVAEEWIKDEEKIKGGRSHRGFKDTEFMLKVNDGESQDLADR